MMLHSLDPLLFLDDPFGVIVLAGWCSSKYAKGIDSDDESAAEETTSLPHRGGDLARDTVHYQPGLRGTDVRTLEHDQ